MPSLSMALSSCSLAAQESCWPSSLWASSLQLCLITSMSQCTKVMVWYCRVRSSASPTTIKFTKVEGGDDETLHYNHLHSAP